jgi:nucleotide-binding universal stress UspA family protein
VRFVTAVGPFFTGMEVEEEMELGHSIQEAAAAELRPAGLKVSCVVKEGDPKHLLVEEAERWGAHCIFVGTSGLNRLQRLLLGSVSQAVVNHAPCSVEVVRAPPDVDVETR